MFTRKKPEPAKRRTHDLSPFGLTEIPDDFNPASGYDDAEGNDSDLESELAAIVGGGNAKPTRKPRATPQMNSDLDKMIADSMRDIGSDDEEDADIENDTDLLGELHNITGYEAKEGINPEENKKPIAPETEQQNFSPTSSVDIIGIIQQRIEMYKIAEASSKEAGESAKARRFGRGLKALLDLQKQANYGKSINVDDIPPEVSVKPKAQEGENEASNFPSRVAPLPPNPAPSDPTSPPLSDASVMSPNTPANAESPKSTNPVLEQMRGRQRDYKAAALQAKRKGDTSVAIQFLKVVKQFEVVIKMVEDGEEVDLSDMPPPPDQFMDFMSKLQKNGEEAQNDNRVDPTPHEKSDHVRDQENNDAPLSMLEALQQRLDKYKSVEASANAEGNSSKSRRFGRIVKQYEDAIKQYKAGRTIAYDELPVPPGFGPLPVENVGTANAAPTPKPEPIDAPTATDGSSSSQASESGTETSSSRPTPEKHDLTTRTSGNQQKNNLAEQQMKILLDRQKEFKIAAIEAKKGGEIDQAKEYLKIFKGFDSLLNAASSGLPVDLSTLPLPPSQRDSLEASFAIVTTEECDPDDDMSDIGIRIEEQLAKQLMMCKNTRDHHKAMGDVAGMNRFENLAVTVQKDLDLVRYSKRKNLSLPKFHYEKRSFNIVHCNTEITDNELEIIVVRGLNYNVPNPKDVDTYVKVEFPLLNDEAFRAKTSVVKNTDSPDYDQHFNVEIQRGNRQFQRIFKRHGVKFEVYSRGGFLRSDTLIGTVNVKLQPLETKCDIHDTFNLMDGRKAVGGKLEIKLRVRNPILTKQVEHIEEKWLVLDA